MNYWYLGASAFTMVTIGAHVLAGGPEIHEPVLQSGLSTEIKAVFSVVWHAITAIMGLSAIALAWAAFGNGSGAVPLIVAQNLAFTGLFLFYGALRMGAMFVFPQWYVFLLLAGLAAMGYWRGVQA